MALKVSVSAEPASTKEIASPDDLSAVGAKMRKDYSAPVVVWRDRARKDLKIVLN